MKKGFACLSLIALFLTACNMGATTPPPTLIPSFTPAQAIASPVFPTFPPRQFTAYATPTAEVPLFLTSMILTGTAQSGVIIGKGGVPITPDTWGGGSVSTPIYQAPLPTLPPPIIPTYPPILVPTYTSVVVPSLASTSLPTPTKTFAPLPPTATRTPVPALPTYTSTPLQTSTPLRSVEVEILGCNTSVDITHGMGEVTNAYVLVKNTGAWDLPNTCALLRAIDEDREHPDKKKCVANLPSQTEITFKLTVDTAYQEDTMIQVDVSSDGILLTRVDQESCKDIELGGIPIDIDTVQPIQP
jgi:hypothetical protein